jgi:hypothetical protein
LAVVQAVEVQLVVFEDIFPWKVLKVFTSAGLASICSVTRCHQVLV